MTEMDLKLTKKSRLCKRTTSLYKYTPQQSPKKKTSLYRIKLI